MSHELNRFIEAQEGHYADALAEIRNGRKTTHWMWFIFPQIQGLGSSVMAMRYAIENYDEAAAYLAHPVLGPRLMEITSALMKLHDLSAHQIFGTPDDMKLRSCCTLFAAVSPPGSVFVQVLDRYFHGKLCERTLEQLNPDYLN